MAAFLTQRTWTQAALARRVGIRTEALRAILRELFDAGVPLTSEKEHPDVVWRVARTWFPGGVMFDARDVPDLLRELGHARPSKARDRLLAIVTNQLPGRGKLTPIAPVVAAAASEQEEQYLPIVEDAAARKVPLHMRYVTASRGDQLGDRCASVHLVEVGPRARFIATCHRKGELRTFRVDGIVRAWLDTNERFRAADPLEVKAYRAASLDGHKGDGAVAEHAFFVREPESSWVAKNLLEGMRAETVQGGIRVTVATSSIVRLARFLVSLGEAARPEDRRVAEAVRALAQGALDRASEAMEGGDSSAPRAASDPTSPRDLVLPGRSFSDV